MGTAPVMSRLSGECLVRPGPNGKFLNGNVGSFLASHDGKAISLPETGFHAHGEPFLKILISCGRAVNQRK